MFNFLTKSNPVGLALILGVSLWLVGCSGQTSQSYVIEGMLIDGTTKAPLSQAQISVFQDNGKDGISTDATSVTVLTDEQGNFDFEMQPFKNKTASEILFSASVNTVIPFSTGPLAFNYSVVWMEIDPADIIATGDDPYVLNLEGTPSGELTIFLETSNRFVSFEDRLTYRITGDDYSYQTPISENDDLNQEFTYPVKGDADAIVQLEAFFGNVQIVVEDTFFCRAGVETFAKIKF